MRDPLSVRLRGARPARSCRAACLHHPLLVGRSSWGHGGTVDAGWCRRRLPYPWAPCCTSLVVIDHIMLSNNFDFLRPFSVANQNDAQMCSSDVKKMCSRKEKKCSQSYMKVHLLVCTKKTMMCGVRPMIGSEPRRQLFGWRTGTARSPVRSPGSRSQLSVQCHCQRPALPTACR
jgi:hypothetical protein